MKSDLDALGSRMHAARKEAGMTQLETAQKLDVSKQLVCHWELGRSEITIFNLKKISLLFGVDVGWLLFGKKAVGPEDRSHAFQIKRGRIVPLLDKHQLLEISNGSLALPEVSERRHTLAECSKNSLSFEIFDSSMDGILGSICSGDIVTVDCDRLPDPGDRVLVVMRRTGEVLLRRFRASAAAKKAVKAPFKLVADNASYEVIEVSKADDVVFMGTMVEHTILQNF